MHHRSTFSSLRGVLLGVALLAALPASATDLVTFSRGALIIPEQATFQQGCGSLSAYGLVWRLLQSNQPGGFNENHPVTVYLAINDTKASPNRCVPSNKHLPPSPNNGTWSDPTWNDGCDFSITNTAEMPVVPVDYSTAVPGTGLYPFAQLNTFRTDDDDDARPGFPNKTLDNSATAPRFSTVQYMGGAFIIDAQDAKNAIDFIRSGTGANSPEKFRTSCSCNSFSSPSTCFYVRMHQATIEFTAPVARRLNRVPPKIALLDLDDNDSTDESYVKGGMLDDYLRNAGLDFPGAGGCPAGTTSNKCKNKFGSTAQGKIYDALHANADLISTATFPHGLLNALDPATLKPRYKVFWAPHWELGNSTRSGYLANGDGAANQKENVLNNIAYFTNQRGNGLFAECASIWSYETGGKAPAQTILSSRFQAASGFEINKLNNGDTWNGRNCTDPDYMNESTPRPQCVMYPNPGDPFSQLGDFRFNNVAGHTENYRATYKSGVRRLAVSWRNYETGERYDNPTDVAESASRGHDFFSFIQKDNDPDKATVVYLAGHDFQNSVPGTRIVLNTLLNLGSEPLESERALSAPVAYDDPNGSDTNGTKALVLGATYDAVSGYPPGVDTYVPGQGSQWVFPFFPGHLRAHSLIGGTALQAGESALGDATLWDADAQLPLPGQRNLFTYFGGEVKTNPSLGAGRSAPRGVLQLGWAPQKVAGTAINATYGAAPNPGCVDKMKLGQATNPDGTFRFDFVPAPTGDGVCDLQQAVEYTPQAPGADFGVSTDATNKAALAADFNAVAQMLQRVRGFCFATSTHHDGSGTPVLAPAAPADCNDPDSDNRAHLGGFVHSSPAVVPPSRYVPDQGNKRRPTVAYAAGLDGQLHAFYVSGGAGYLGPAGTLSFLNANATAAFDTDWATRFQNSTLPPRGTELWSFLPATQLPWLRNNNARVNSAPVAFDVFGDFVGSGKREWHTVLVANVGQTGRDLFALDVTNPLKPVMLWHLVGSHMQVGLSTPPHAPLALADRSTGGTQWAHKWDEATAAFLLPPQTDAGRIPTGLYDYSELGGTRGLSVGVVRVGLEPVYAVFVASSSSGANGAPAKGIQVFAIDAATGQKLWQWQQAYTSSWVDNTAPMAPTVLMDTSGASRLYVGDMEGRMWELDAATGQNLNVARLGPACTPSAPCKYAALDTGSTATSPQPITTNISLARLPATITTGTTFAGYAGELVALVGTGGADWVPDTAPGRFHALLMDRRRRLPAGVAGQKLDGTAITAGQAHTLELAQGMLQEPVPFPLSHTGPEHIYGNITVAGRTAWYTTARNGVNDLMQLSGLTSGATYSIDLGNASKTASQTATPLPGASLANYGGVAVFTRENPDGTTRTNIIGQEVGAIRNTALTDSTALDANKAKSELSVNKPGGYIFELLNWSQRFFE